MKLIDISTNCYAHLMDNTIYLYVDGEFSEMLHSDDIEEVENPIPLIMHEIELSSKASLYECMQFL
jgi:hypothetical protein